MVLALETLEMGAGEQFSCIKISTTCADNKYFSHFLIISNCFYSYCVVGCNCSLYFYELLLLFFKGFCNFSFEFFAQFRIVFEHALHSFAALTDLCLAVAEP